MAIYWFSSRGELLRHIHCHGRSSSCIHGIVHSHFRYSFHVFMALLVIFSCSSSSSSTSVVATNSVTPSRSVCPGSAVNNEFDDIVSRTFASQIVFDGQLVRNIDDVAASSVATGNTHRQRHQNKRTSTSWAGEFRIQAILKNGQEDEAGGSSNSVVVKSLVIVTTASSTSSLSGCISPSVTPRPTSAASKAALPVVGNRYLVFVGGLQSASIDISDVDGGESETSTRRWRAIGLPVKYTKKTAQQIKANSCTDCGR